MNTAIISSSPSTELFSRNRMNFGILLPPKVPPPSSPPPTVKIYDEDTSQRDISEGDIEEFAKILGIDLDKEPHFRTLVEEGLLAPLPPEWKPCKILSNNQFYYFNIKTKESQWEHPLNQVYRDKILQTRQDRAMNRITELSSSASSRPPKSLPPLRKFGMSRPPTATSSSIHDFGGGGGRGPLPNRLEDNLTLTRVNETLGVLNQELERYDQDSDLPPPSSRMVKKPSSNLMLTGQGASFLKQPPSTSTHDNNTTILSSSKPKSITFDDFDDDYSPPQQLLATTIVPPPPPPPTKSILSQKNSNSRKGLLNVIDSQEWMLKPEIMTGEEKRLLSDLNIPLKDKHGVKFSLDDDTQLKFDPVESDTSDSRSKHTNSDEKTPSALTHPKLGKPPIYPKSVTPNSDTDTDESKGHGSTKTKPPLPIPKDRKVSQPLGDGGAGEKVVQPEEFSMPETNLEERKAALRHSMETELRKYQDILENERKEREAQMKKHTEMTLEEFRSENDEFIKKARQDSEAEKNVELDKIKSELQLMVKLEVDKLNVIFDKELDNRKAEIRKKHDTAMSLLTQEFDALDDPEKASIFQKTLSESTLKFNNQLKEHKDNLRTEQRKQIQQIRDYHETVIEKLKQDFSSEETRLRSEHKDRISQISAQLERESAILEQKLKSEQQSSKLETLKNDVISLKSAVHGNNSVSSSSSPAKSLPPTPPQPPPSAPPNKRQDIKILTEKYDHLEKKYTDLKKELRKITDVAAARRNQKSHHHSHHKKEARNSESDAILEDSMSMITESESTAAYPSTYNNNNNTRHNNNSSRHRQSSSSSRSNKPVPRESVNVNDDDVEQGSGERTGSPVEGILDENNDKLSSALKSLETLKTQILEIQQSRPNSAAVVVVNNNDVSTLPTPKTRNNTNKASNPNNNNNTSTTPSKRKQPTNKTSTAPSVPTTKSFIQPYTAQNLGQNQRRNGGGNSHNTRSTHTNRLRPSKSTPELPGLLEAVDSDDNPEDSQPSSHQIVQDAKEFIRTQKERLMPQHQQPRPFTNTELALQAIQNSYMMTSRPKTSPFGEGHVANFSETESSGIGSSINPGTTDHLKSTEKKKISKDIEAICSSLSHLDEQMKLMWNVVNTNNNNNNSTTLSSRPLDLTQTQSYPGLLQQNNNKNNYLQPPQIARLTPSNLLNSLDKELQEFKATKERILSQFSSSNKNKNNSGGGLLITTTPSSSGRSGGDNQASIQDKTKDLRQWLEKF